MYRATRERELTSLKKKKKSQNSILEFIDNKCLYLREDKDVDSYHSYIEFSVIICLAFRNKGE